MKYVKGTILETADGIQVFWNSIPKVVTVVMLPPGGVGSCPVECYEPVAVSRDMMERCIEIVRAEQKKWLNRRPPCSAAKDLTTCEDLAARSACDGIESAIRALVK